MVHIKETFLAHTIISIAKGKTLPNHHLDLNKLEQNITRYIKKRAEERGKEITKETLDEITKDLLKYTKKYSKD